MSLKYVRPVTGDNRWHQTQLSRVPQTGEEITLLCGRVERVEFGADDSNASTLTCWNCEREYRRREGMPPMPELEDTP